ncbi:MAG TPA: amino acid ABC transporter ATP-binding protein [Streptosporangiaceae bacterium]|nr:amino acid ABC transporter ATP-binding protein [Streptosporangiaceae bacterium]
MTDSPLLRVEGVWKTYHHHPVLRGVDLDVAKHEVICLIGASGSGKSTLLRSINLLETIDDGAIFLDGRDITDVKADPDEARKHIGMVFQSFNLFPHMSVLDNITLAPIKVHKRPRAQAVEEARELLARFGLDAKAGEYPDRLSGGQQQRVAIIRAMATRPSLLLLDEVTSALDPELVTDVLGIIRDLKRSGMTMVLATHEMGFARDISDTVCFLHDGVLLERGAPEQIFTDPTEPRTREFLQRILESRRL